VGRFDGAARMSTLDRLKAEVDKARAKVLRLQPRSDEVRSCPADSAARYEAQQELQFAVWCYNEACRVKGLQDYT
jgi:hypothetical protein